MAERMAPVGAGRLLRIMATQRRTLGSIFDIHPSAWVAAEENARAARLMPVVVLNEGCTVPVGPAAGPHTHLAQSIVSAWLVGARYIELKTVQVLDELEIEKPCIDAADIGFNTEWSTELRLPEAAREYVTAWLLIHALAAIEGQDPPVAGPGTIFAMSVGYDYAGITGPAVDHFIDVMAGREVRDGGGAEQVGRIPSAGRNRSGAAAVDPEAGDLAVTDPAATDPAAGDLFAAVQAELLAEIGRGFGADGPWAGREEVARAAVEAAPREICRSVALSTMHGAPPEDIERIVVHLLERKGLDVVLKMNPTLLGIERVREVLQGLGHQFELDPESFEHDLAWDEAMALVGRVAARASGAGRAFAVKLSNTLPVRNPGAPLPGKTRYLSGRALFPLTVELAARVATARATPISYSAGADALTIPRLLAAGVGPITVSTDLLKPGGYARLGAAVRAALTEMAGSDHPPGSVGPVDGDALAELALWARGSARYRARREPVTARLNAPLPLIDCFIAPCISACPIGQNVPGYIRAAARGKGAEALSIIQTTNPFPALTAALCDQRCAQACTRLEYEGPVQIRRMKGIALRCASAQAASSGDAATIAAPAPAPDANEVVVDGDGVTACSEAYFHVLAGRRAALRGGRGTVARAIAGELRAYRVPDGAIDEDLDRIARAGVRFGAGDAPERSDASAAAQTSDPSVAVDPQPRPMVVDLIAAGKAAAENAADTAGSGVASEVLPTAESSDTVSPRMSAQHREELLARPGGPVPPGRGTDRDVAAVESGRCLECSLVCLKCVQVCPNRANVAIPMKPEDGARDAYQIVHLDSWCNDCGNCATFCPYNGAPYREKFTIFDSASALKRSSAPGVFSGRDSVYVRWELDGAMETMTRAAATAAAAGPAVPPPTAASASATVSDDAQGLTSDGNRGVRSLLRRVLLDHACLLPGAPGAETTPTQRGDTPC
jgi:putative selenate reductase